MYNYAGNIHIHSTHSDGTSSIEEIAADAKAAGLDYIIITDHHSRAGAHQEGNYGGTHVIVGAEFNEAANHYLALNTTAPVADNSEAPQATIDEVNRQGGFGFLAHPFETGSPLVSNGACYPWTDWSVRGFTGMELWNYSSQWRGKATGKLRIIFWYFLNRDAPVKSGPSPKCLQTWDQYTIDSPVVGIGGTDAHAIKYKVGPFTAEVFPYLDLFHTINTYICLPEKIDFDPQVARSQILDALRVGRCYLCYDRYRSSGRNFYFAATGHEIKENQENKTDMPMGSQASLDSFTSPPTLQIKAPHSRAVIRVLRNGETFHKEHGRALSLPVEQPGTYRVEIYHRSLLGRCRPWIYSNPIYFK